MKKYLPYILIVILLVAFFSPAKQATAVPCTAPGTPPGCTDPNYYLLAPLPCENGTPGCEGGKLVSFNPVQRNNLGFYLNIMIKIIIGLAAVLSVVMIVIGGVEYMTSELSHSKEAGKDKITHAILGLLIALGAYALLFTINPDLLNSDPTARVTVTTIDPNVLGTCTFLENGQHDKTETTTQAVCFEKANRGDTVLGWTANATPQAASWYFEYRPFTGNNVIMGPFSTEAICRSQLSPTDSVIVRSCFRSNTPPTTAAQTGTWYFEYDRTTPRSNVFSGPWSTQAECQSKTFPVGSTLMRPCFQSESAPTLTTPTWYFEYRSGGGVNAGTKFIFGPFATSAGCTGGSGNIVGTITRQCFQSNTQPTVSR